MKYNRSHSLAQYFIVCCIFLSLTHAIICNEKPLTAMYQGERVFPALHDFWSDICLADRSNIIFVDSLLKNEIACFIPYSHQAIGNYDASLLPPLTQKHLFGTDKLGRDIFAGTLRGMYNALRIGLLSTLFAAIFGILLGMIMAHFGDDKIRFNLVQYVLLVCIILLLVFYVIYGFHSMLRINILCWISFGVVSYFMLKATKKISALSNYTFPLDHLLSRVVEIRKAMPLLILVLALLPIFSKVRSMNVVFILSLLTWPFFTRHSRSETMVVKEQEYVLHAKAIGISMFDLFRKYYLPNIMPTIKIVFIFCLIGNILLESTLSFLGIGMPIQEVSWGSMLNEGRKSLSAWWLTLFPGLVLFLLVYSLNILAIREDNG